MPPLTGGTYEDAVEYCNKVKSIPRLTREEECELGRRVKANPEDLEARDLLVTRNLAVPIHVAKKYAGCGLSFSDLIQEGNLGLLRAVNTYDPSHGVCFLTYAYYSVKHRVYRAIADKSRLIRVCRTTRKMSSDIRKGLMPSKSALKKRLKYLNMTSADDIASLSLYNTQSLDTEVCSRQEKYSTPTLLKDVMSDPSAEGAFHSVDQEEFSDKRRAEVFKALTGLEPFEREVVEYIFGLNGRKILNFRQIGEIKGCSRQNIYIKYVKALDKIRKFGKGLSEYVPE